MKRLSSDAVNPILIKELRQGIRSKLFLGAFFAIQGLLFLYGTSLLMSASFRRDTESGAALFWTALALPLLVLVPSMASQSIEKEMGGKTLELLLVTRLSSMRLLLGKWASVVVQATLLATTALLAAACTTSTGQESAERAPGSDPALLSAFDYERLDPAAVTTQPEGITVEQSFVLDFYTLFHSRKYTVTRVLFPGVDGEAVAHLALPPGPGPHPTVVVYPILAGSHIVSEGLSKALVRRGFAVARLERVDLELDNPDRTLRDLRQALHSAVIDGRRLLDWLETLPEVDPQRLAAAGVSMGGIQALLLSAADSRVRGGFYLMVGGGLPQILWESTERPVRTFRDNLIQRRGLDSREAFEELARPIPPPPSARDSGDFLAPPRAARRRPRARR